MTGKRKVYIVNVSLEFDMAVVATDPEEAREVAEENFEEELQNVRYETCFHPRVVDKCPKDFQEVLPWGPANSDPRRDWTCKQWFEAKGKEENR